MKKMVALLAAALAVCLGISACKPASPADRGAVLPQHELAVRYFGNDAPWFEKSIPFFECSDPELTRTYYYRWQLYKSHLKDIGSRGYIVTEFLGDVGWAWNPYQSLDDATTFHINEGRWLRDDRYVDDYITYMYSGANDRHFSEAISAAVYGRYLVNGDRAFALKNLAGMKHLYEMWTNRYDAAKGMYFIEPIADATEYTISSVDASGGKDGFFGGDAFRPTINSFMYGNALAISKLSALAGDSAAAADYAAKAAALKAKVQTNLWNDTFEHFIDRYKVNNRFVHYWDFIRGRELAGYVPWAFELPDQDSKYQAAWAHLLATNDFAGPFGLRTVEPSYEYYMRQYRYETVNGVKHPECQWNGPSWPFDTTLVLQAMANYLNNYTQTVVRADDYVRFLKQYAQQHYQAGEPDLQEDYNPDTGAVIVGLARSHHYNHSAFNDLIISGLVGLRPRSDDQLEINPLIPSAAQAGLAIDYFCLENVAYHGQNVTILYDRDGQHYGRGAGLQVYVDGRQVLAPAALGRKIIPIAAPSLRTNSAPAAVNLAVNFIKQGFPVPSASINNQPADLYQAVDGRVWFYPNVRNYWSSTGSTTDEDWYSLDFGGVKSFRTVNLYFYADNATFKAPTNCRLQYWQNNAWADVPQAHLISQVPVANGETTITFPPVTTSKLRVVFTLAKPAAVALVEFKAFE